MVYIRQDFGGANISNARDIRSNNTVVNAAAHQPSVFELLGNSITLHAAYNSSECQSKEASTYEEQTRVAVLKKITAWVAGGNDHPGCWLHGPAGSGKSTIAHTLAQLYDERKRLAFSFFFSRQDLDRRDATKFFLTFAYQLTVAIPLVEPAVRDALVKDHLTLYQSFKDQFTKLIVSPLQSIKDRIPCMVIIIDGLDECGNQGDVADIIQLLMNASPQLPFRLLFTSRPEAYIHTIFTGGGIAGNNYSITLHFLETMAARQAMHASQNILDTFPALPDPNRCSPFRTALKSLTKPTGIPGIQAGRPVSELTALQSCNISSSVSHNTLSHVADFSLAASSMILQFLVRAAYNSSAPCFQEAAGLALGIVECVQAAKTNKAELNRLADDACALVWLIIKIKPEMKPWPADLHDNLIQLTSTLAEIAQFAKQRASRSFLKRFLMLRDDIGQVAMYRNKLKHALSIFSLQSDVHLRETVYSIFDELVMIRQTLQKQTG